MSGMPPSRPSRPSTRSRLVAAASVLLVVASTGCAEPALPEAEQGEGAPQPVEAQIPEPGRDEVVAWLGELRTAVAAARDELAAAVETPDASAAQRGTRAVALLIDAPGLDGDDASVTPVFPSTTTERGSIEGADDLLTVTSTAARDAGGELGRATLELLRDPLAGDLGTWQQDPAGVVTAVRAVADRRGELPALEQAVLELPGEGTRALAWALLTSEARDGEAAAAYAERGVAHLELILLGIDDLLGEVETGELAGDPPATSGAPDDGGDDAGGGDAGGGDAPEEGP
jgi:hypothetical protein